MPKNIVNTKQELDGIWNRILVILQLTMWIYVYIYVQQKKKNTILTRKALNSTVYHSCYHCSLLLQCTYAPCKLSHFRFAIYEDKALTSDISSLSIKKILIRKAHILLIYSAANQVRQSWMFMSSCCYHNNRVNVWKKSANQSLLDVAEESHAPQHPVVGVLGGL